MVHNVVDYDNVIGIFHNRALEILSQPGEAVLVSQYMKGGVTPRSSHLNFVYVSQKKRYGGPAALLETFVNGSIVPIRFRIRSLHMR